MEGVKPLFFLEVGYKMVARNTHNMSKSDIAIFHYCLECENTFYNCYEHPYCIFCGSKHTTNAKKRKEIWACTLFAILIPLFLFFCLPLRIFIGDLGYVIISFIFATASTYGVLTINPYHSGGGGIGGVGGFR